MKRRSVVACIGAVAATRLARAQPTDQLWRLGFLRPGEGPAAEDLTLQYLITGLGELGYREGRNLVVDARYAEGKPALLVEAVRELVRAGADVIVAVGSPAIRAAMQATNAVPIVMYGNFDPVALGLVTNLARPGGNVTGILIAPGGTLAGKRLELLHAAATEVNRFALLAVDEPSFQPQVQETRHAASALGVALEVVEMRDRDYDRAFAAMAGRKVGALVVGAHQYFMRDRRPIVALAARYRLPAMYEWREQVEAGGLMSYGTSLAGRAGRIAWQVDRIFRGTRAGDLPVEQPTRFELAINRKTARSLALALPQSLLLRADKLID